MKKTDNQVGGEKDWDSVVSIADENCEFQFHEKDLVNAGPEQELIDVGEILLRRAIF